MKTVKRILDIFSMIYCGSIVLVVTLYLLAFAIFGGSFEISINF